MRTNSMNTPARPILLAVLLLVILLLHLLPEDGKGRTLEEVWEAQEYCRAVGISFYSSVSALSFFLFSFLPSSGACTRGRACQTNLDSQSAGL